MCCSQDVDDNSFLLRALPLWHEGIPEEKRLPLLSKPLLKVVADIKVCFRSMFCYTYVEDIQVILRFKLLQVSKIQKFIQKRLAGEDLQILPTQIEIWLDSM